MHRINANDQSRRTRLSTSPAPRHNAPILWGVAAVLLTLMTVVAAAAKPPQLIRKHLLERVDNPAESVSSVEPVERQALEDLLDVHVWKIEYRREGEDGTNLVFMAVKDGEVLRILRFDQPAARDNLVELLPDDFRVTSKDDAATLSLYFGFPFGEPEKTVGNMRFAKRDGEYFFVDGERFGDATGYRIATDGEGRVTSYEYSRELPVRPSAQD